MKLWQRRLFGILALGGGAVGFAVTLQIVLTKSNPIEWLFCLAFIAMYSWGIWCGLRLIEGQPGAERSNTIYWLLQVPYFLSPVFGYFFTSGFHLTVSLQFAPANFNANFLLGSTMLYSLLQADKPLVFGVNLFALAAALYMNRLAHLAVSPPNHSFEPEPLRDSA
ncbi:hypothetical protein [Lysobacter terrae]